MATATADPAEAATEATVRILTDDSVGSHLISAPFEAWQETITTLRSSGKEGTTQANAITAMLRGSNQDPVPGSIIEIEMLPSTETEGILNAIQSAMPDTYEQEFGDYKRKTRTARTGSGKASTNGSPSKSTAKKKGVAKECRCGCGEMTGGGTFRPGHDARFKGQMLRLIDEGGPEGEDALAQLKEFPNLYNYDEAVARLGSGPTKLAAKNARLAELKASKAQEAANADDEDEEDEEEVEEEEEATEE